MALPAHMLRPRASGLGFDPRSIAGLEMYLNAKVASSITLNGSNVSEWRDLSGKGRNASQGTAANQPAYGTGTWLGKPSVNFTHTSSHFLSFTPFALTTQTAFFVIEPTVTPTGFGMTIAAIYTSTTGQSNRWGFGIAVGYTEYGASLGAATTGTPNAVGVNMFAEARMLISHTYNANGTSTTGNHGIRKDRAQRTVLANGIFGQATNAGLIGIRPGNVEPISARYAMILLYNRVLSAAEIAAVENWAVSEYPLA